MTTKNKNSLLQLPGVDIDDHREKSRHAVPSPYILLLLSFYLLMAYFAQSMEDMMPAVIKKWDVPKSTSNVFSEESARKYLNTIIGDQPRVSGTVYHFVKTRDLKTLVDSIARDAITPVRTDWQYESGDYWLELSSPHVNCYQNLSNVIAVLEGESGFERDGSTGTSVLVNCHYDSVPYAIGASDNGVFCAVMVEVLAELSRRKKKFRHNVVFLFNGAEETPLQASHAFLNHAWSSGVTNVINLDSAGMNGLPNLFQATDRRLLSAYRRTCPRPSAQSLGEALFASGIIPSDTDFRIFRDFGHISGVDIAFVKWGSVYHTRNDEPSHLLDGVVQNAGNMLLGLISEVADDQQLAEKVPVTPMVYYDYLTVFMISYTPTLALVVDILAALVGATSVLYYLWTVGFRQSSATELLLAALGRILSGLIGICTVLVAALLMYFTTSQLRYLARPLLVVALYHLPMTVAAVAVSHWYDSWLSDQSGLKRLLRAAQAMAGTRLLLTVALLVLLAVPAATPVRYLLTVPLVIMSLGSFVSLSLLKWSRPSAWVQLLVDTALTLPAVLFSLSLALRMSALLLPVAGRSGSSCPDCTTALVSAGMALIILIIPSGVELMFSRRRLWLPLLLLAIPCLVCMFLPFSPYEDVGVTTQRHYWFHTQMTSYDENMKVVNRTSGVLVTKVDALSVDAATAAILDTDPSLRAWRVTVAHCEGAVYCDMPLYRPRFDRYLVGSAFVETGPPDDFPHQLRLESRACDRGVCSLYFTMDSSPHNTLTVWPRAGVNLTSWSFSSPVSRTATVLGRPVYVVAHAVGTYSEPLPTLDFVLTFDVGQPPPAVLADVSHHAHLIHHPEHYSAFYRRLLDAMPKYFNVATFMTFKSNYVF